MTVRDELGITDSEYEELLEASNHRCWICRNPETVPNRRLAVDHDHRTGAVRGLLCTSCNVLLGGMVDPEWFLRAAEYLKVAACAFGDGCHTCHRSAPSRVLEVRGDGATFEYRCCGRRWTCWFRTKGLPRSWLFNGLPVPHDDAPLSKSRLNGHPGVSS